MGISKADFLAASIPEISPIYSYTAEIDTTPTASSPTWAKLCKGFENLTEALNEQVQQYFFLCGNGFAANYVTGMAPTMTLSGRRVLGDAAQEYIFGKKYGTMADRETNFRLTRRSADGTETAIVSAHVTLCNISDIGGVTTDGSACSVEVRFDGEPFVGDAWAV